MRYELQNTSFGTPTNSFDVKTDENGAEISRTPTGKMFIGITLQLKDNDTINPNNTFQDSLTVEFDKTITANDIEAVCEKAIETRLNEINV